MTFTGELVRITKCAQCGCSFSIPKELFDSAKASFHVSFFCPFGHSNYYPKGESEADKLRRELARAQQRLAERDDTIRVIEEARAASERRAAAARGQVTKLRNRVGAGVCPCCNRSFAGLARHMANMHPGFRAEAV